MADAILQAHLEKAAKLVWEGVNGRCSITLIAQYREDSSGNGHAFVTTLDLEPLTETLEYLLAKWGSDEPIERDPLVWVPDMLQLKQLAEEVKAALPFSAAFGALFASGRDVLYVSFTPRSEMQRFIEGKLLPHLRARMAVSVQPGSAEA